MATEAHFQSKFIKPLIDCYGQNKFPEIRIKKIWERFKAFPDHLLSQCADRIILNFDNFPGLQTIFNTCAEVGAEFGKAEAEKLKKSIQCHKCSSQGVVVVSNLAYKCHCQLGELLYPAYQKYGGQVEFDERRYSDDEGHHFENAVIKAFRPKGSTNIRDLRVIIKEPNVLPFKKERQDFKSLSFEDLKPTEGA